VALEGWGVDTATCDHQARSGHGHRAAALGTKGGVEVADQEPQAAGRAHGDPQQAKTLPEHTHDPSRVLALSDGVFAIILTLLVLDLHLPQLTKGLSLGRRCGRSAPRWSPL
jgi:hypothetical protein